MRSPASLGLSLALLLGACGQPAPAPETAVPPAEEPPAGLEVVDLTDRTISDAELETMVLRLEDFGDGYRSMSVDPDTGIHTNELVIAQAVSSTDEQGDVERFGRLTGFAGIFIDWDRVAGGGVVAAGSAVSLFETPEGASGYLADALRDLTSITTARSPERVERFDVREPGEEQAGVRLIWDDSSDLLVETRVVFRTGRLLAEVAIGRTDREDVSEEAAALAVLLDERIRGVLEGEISRQAFPRPDPVVVTGSGGTPVEVLDSFATRLEFWVASGAEEVMRVETEGVFVAPSDQDCRTTVTIGELVAPLRVVVVGERAWVDGGEGLTVADRRDTALQEALGLCPTDAAFWADFDFSEDLAALSGEPVEVAGVPARRFDLSGVAGELAGVGLIPELDGLQVDTLHVWLADPGGWTLAYEMGVSGPAEALNQAFGDPLLLSGQHGSWWLEFHLHSINDPTLEVRSPAAL